MLNLLACHQFEWCCMAMIWLSELYKVWAQDFAHKLRVRRFGHHAKCSTCIRHRSILKKLGSNTLARQSQTKRFKLHLKRQYEDRRVYWSSRSLARAEASKGRGERLEHACLILDSMDQAKHAVPRSPVFLSKELCNTVRPRLTSTTLISHGHHVISCLSPPKLPSNSSKTCEMLAYSLSKLGEKYDLRACHVDCQGDNAAKELKNVTSLRYGAVLVALHAIKSFRCSFLSSGHSHEDIDGLFSVMSSWYTSYRELHDEVAFKECLDAFMQKPTTRKNEPMKETILLHQVRDWTFDSIQFDSVLNLFIVYSVFWCFLRCI